MDANQYVGDFLNAKAIPKGGLPVRIKDCRAESIGEGEREKLVLSFDNIPQELALNKTNLSVLIERFNAETKGWVGKSFVLEVVDAEYMGRMVPAVRIKKE